MTTEKLDFPKDLKEATGAIRYTFLNDFMFHAILQDKKNEKILKSLVCACLHLQPAEIIQIEVTNPLIFGEKYDDKSFVLDLNVLLNKNTSINLEMQVLNFGNWPERSLSYLSRNFDNLTKGSDYIDVAPAYQIGFLDFTLFPEHPEFFAKYQMINTNNHHLLTSKFNLYVIDLNQIELATDEDKKDQLDYWAKLFKAKTWEEIKMIANANPELMSATEELYKKNQDDIFTQQCRAREEYYAFERHREQKLIEMDKIIQEQKSELVKQQQELESAKKTITELNKLLNQ